MKTIASLILVFNTLTLFATNYYVSPAGNNSNNGLSIETTFLTLNHAANQVIPGDTVFVLNGTYTNSSSASNVLDIYASGTALNRIVFKNYLGHSPIIKLNANNWSGIALQGADYITIDGFQIVGNNDSVTLKYALAEQENTNNPSTSGNGIGLTREYNNDSNRPHHNVIRNCTISKCGGAGIYGYRADYTTIENNTIFECAWYSPYGNSGISLYQNWNSDSLDGFRNFIIGNTCYRNENYIPFIAVGSITDGNGIIIDDGRNTQNESTQGEYLGATLIANNLIYDNGGRGIHVYLSDNILVVNNTCFENCQSPAVMDGELTAYSADSITYINNIVSPSANIPPIDHSNTSTTNLTVDHNIWVTNSSLASTFGTNTLVGGTHFISPSSNPVLADFHLLSSSSAIGSGEINNAPLTDKDGNIRLIDDAVDIGCYEYQAQISIKENTKFSSEIEVFPNPAAQFVTLQMPINNSELLEITLINLQGQVIKRAYSYPFQEKITIDISDMNSGLYIIKSSGNSSGMDDVKLIIENH